MRPPPPSQSNSSQAGGIAYIDDRASFEGFVRKFQFVLIAACLFAAVGIVTADNHGQMERVMQTGAFVALVLFSRWALRFGESVGAGVLVVGLTLLNAVFIFRFSGVHSANVLIFPMLAAFAGWALGRRWLWGVMLFTMLVLTVLAAGEVSGVYQPKPRAGAILVAGVGISVMLGTAFLTNAVFADFASSRQRLTTMSAQLSEQNRLLTQQNAALSAREHEVQQLNQSLEARVQQRTRELQDALEKLGQSQEGLARAERLAALGALVAGVSHELNTPIGNSITAASTLHDHAQTLHRQVESNTLRKSQLMELSAQMQHGSDLVLRNLGRAAELIQSFKQVSVDQTSEQLRAFDLAQLISDVVLTLSPSLRHQPQLLSVSVPPNIALRSYPGPLGQVITNLVQNAYNHAFDDAHSHGAVQISATLCSLADGRNGACIVVEDNGAGIAEQHLGRLFEPFFTTKMGRGTGLGLNIVYNIVRDVLGGDIVVHSNVGQGTTFAVSVPLQAHPEA